MYAISKCRLLPIPVAGAISSIYTTIACSSVQWDDWNAGATSKKSSEFRDLELEASVKQNGSRQASGKGTKHDDSE